VIFIRKGQFESCSCSSCTPTAAAVAIANSTTLLKMRRSRNFLFVIEHYQNKIDPEMKRRLHKERICRYYPTCSEYTKQAIRKYGSFLGIVKGAFRILRCNPFSSGGYDPVR
jgi:putative membrane protein insertion efficiency factor